MMDAAMLQDRIGKGMGVAARKSGVPVSVYRPTTNCQPVNPQNHIMDLCALFVPGGGRGSVGYNQPLWRGIYDTAYVSAGDYLVGDEETFFVASQRSSLPAQCVLTNRMLDVVRPAASVSGGYSGFFATSGTPVLTQWQASLLEAGQQSSRIGTDEIRLGGWVILLPPYEFDLQVGDVVNDELGGIYVVGAAEQNALGWRLLARQVNA